MHMLCSTIFDLSFVRRLYAVGGRDGSSCLRSVESFDPHTNRSEKNGFIWGIRIWSHALFFSQTFFSVQAPLMCDKQPNWWPSVILTWELICSPVFLKVGENQLICNLNLCRWNSCAPMAKRRGGVGVATWHGFLYAIGGHDAPASSLSSRLSDCVERWVHAR